MILNTNNQDDFKIVSISNGTVTRVEVVTRRVDPYLGETWEQLGIGTAKRRKGDRRDETLGMSLALRRAFQDAASYYGRIVDERLGEE